MVVGPDAEGRAEDHLATPRKWDRGCNHFCTGLRTEKSSVALDGDVYNELLRCRQEAFDEAISERLQHEVSGA